MWLRPVMIDVIQILRVEALAADGARLDALLAALVFAPLSAD